MGFLADRSWRMRSRHLAGFSCFIIPVRSAKVPQSSRSRPDMGLNVQQKLLTRNIGGTSLGTLAAKEGSTDAPAEEAGRGLGAMPSLNVCYKHFDIR